MNPVKSPKRGCPLAMDCAYHGDQARALARQLGHKPIVPPNPLRLKPWKLDKRLYRRLNEIERPFRSPKAFRRILTRHYKLDSLFSSFVLLALIFIFSYCVNTP